MPIKFVPASRDSFCENPACIKVLRKTHTSTYGSGDRVLTVLDRPIMVLCKQCVKQWAEMWVEFGGDEPEMTHKKRRYGKIAA